MSEPINRLTARQRKPAGRHSEYDDLVATEICYRISNGESLASICRDERMPAASTVYLWLLQQKQFADSYARAREEQADTLADEIHSIADEPPKEVVDDKGIVRVDSGWVTWQKNRVDARKWVAAKLKPKKYGERQILAGDAENPVEVKHDLAIFDSILTNLELKRQDK